MNIEKKKRRKLYMLLVMLSLNLFKKLVWLLWGIIDDLSHLGFVKNENTLCIFGLGKGFVYVVSNSKNLPKIASFRKICYYIILKRTFSCHWVDNICYMTMVSKKKKKTITLSVIGIASCFKQLKKADYHLLFVKFSFSCK